MATRFSEGNMVKLVDAKHYHYDMLGLFFRVSGEFLILETPLLDRVTGNYFIPPSGALDDSFELVTLPQIGQLFTGIKEISKRFDFKICSVDDTGLSGMGVLLAKGTGEVEADSHYDMGALNKNYWLIDSPSSATIPTKAYNHKRSECPYCTLSRHNLTGLIVMPGYGKPLECLECDPSC